MIDNLHFEFAMLRKRPNSVWGQYAIMEASGIIKGEGAFSK